MNPTFKITIKDLDGKDQDLSFQKKTTIKNLGDTTLISLKIKKEMYAPAHVEAVLQIELNNSPLPIAKFGHGKIIYANEVDGVTTFGKSVNYQKLLGKFVEVHDGTKAIAKDYIIFDHVPEYKPSKNGTSLFLTLNIYSPEKILSYQKYNKCYVAKKLGADIFKGIAAKFPNELKNISYENLQRINTQDADGKDTEFIQPYLVQYEETALDFLTRCANRCGEFMFYENGVWQLGLKPGTATNLDNFTSITFKDRAKSEEEENYFTNNYLKDEKETKEIASEEATRSYTGPSEEYLDVLVEGESDFFTSFAKNYKFKDPSYYVNKMGTWLKKANFAEILATVGTDLIKNSLKTKWKFDDIEDKWTEKFITPYKDNKEQSATVNKKKVVSQFSNYNACDTFSKLFYTRIRKEEIDADAQTIHVNLGTYYQSILLGDIIKVFGVEYVVVRVSATCQQDTTVETAGQYTTYEFDAIPMVSFDGQYCPPRVETKTAMPSTMTAYVAANNDPCNLGRIQIRYPWQSKKDTPSSPWIRVSQAFASKDAGISFRPQVGDEIIVGYEFGEIERPYMLGALASKARKIKIGETAVSLLQNDTEEKSVNTFCNNDFMIKSPNGQFIKFATADSITNFAKAFSPAVGAWLSYLPMKADHITYATDEGKKFSGGITMGDAYGFFNVQMSTEKRNITISSTLGDVKIDALTGITISAPCGNVKIEGKNIDIVAGNNLTLKSGDNVKKMTKAYGKDSAKMQMLKSSFINSATKELSTIIKPFDMKLLRTVIEGFAKPIGGTTLIKSQRFMRLEAGKGSTKLPHTAYTKDSKTQKQEIEKTIKELKAHDIIKSVLKYMDNIKGLNVQITEDVKTATEEYRNCADLLGRTMYAATAMGYYPSYDGTVTKTKSQTAFMKLFNKNRDASTHIIRLAKDPYAEQAESHEKIDKIKFSKSYTKADVNKMIADLKTAAEKLYIMAKTAENVDDRKETIAEGSIECSDALYIAKVGDLDAYKKEIKDILLEFYDQIQQSKTSTFEYPIPKKRKVIYDVLQKLAEKKYVTIKNDEGIWNYFTVENKLNKVELNDSVCEDTNKWGLYLKCVKAYEKDGLGMKFLKWAGSSIADEMYDLVAGWGENQIYNPEVDGGEILMSDSAGNTRNIQGDIITSVPNSPLGNAIGVLKGIKAEGE